MAETAFAKGPPPFPPEEIEGWTITWVRAEFGPGRDTPWIERSTGLAIVATHAFLPRKRMAVRLRPGPATDARLADARDLLLDVFRDWRMAVMEIRGAFQRAWDAADDALVTEAARRWPPMTTCPHCGAPLPPGGYKEHVTTFPSADSPARSILMWWKQHYIDESISDSGGEASGP